jgi:hypothetical protein
MAGIDRFGQGLAAVWAGFVIGMVVWVHGDVTGSGSILVASAAVIAVLASLYGIVALDAGHRTAGGISLVVAAIAAPTFAAEVLNLLPLAVGLLLVAGVGHREQAQVLAGSPRHGALHRR